MNTKHVNNGIRTLTARRQNRRALTITTSMLALVGALLGATSVAASGSALGGPAPNCGVAYDETASYPTLPEASGPDVSGAAGVMLYIDQDHAVVELDGCFYEADRPIEIDFAGLDFVTLLFELPDAGAEVFVSVDRAWIETIELPSTSTTFSYVLTPDNPLGFEVAAPAQTAPTVPVVVAKPTDHNPEPT